MSIKFPHKIKHITPHPWERTIKGSYAGKIKHAHNSIHNVEYPQEKLKELDADRIKFTIIGDRVTKEFNFCIQIAKGLHKYRCKTFDAPIIKAVSTPDWPLILNEIKLEYGGLAFCLDNSVAVIVNDKLLGGEKEFRDLIFSKYHYHIVLDYYTEGVAQFVNYVRGSGRPCAYMHFSVNAELIGTMIFMLYADIAPKTCENFLRLCLSKRGGYSGTPVHRIVKDGWIQCGGFGLKNVEFDCENFIVPHDRRGVLCMANDGRHVECSTQFFVLLQPAPWMAQNYVAFGQLIDGESTLEKIESIPTWYESPLSEIIISNSGILNMESECITINKGTNEYLHGHIEDLEILGKLFYDALLEKVFLEIEFRLVVTEEQLGEAEATVMDEAGNNIRATERFIRNKEDIERQLQKSQSNYRRASSAITDYYDENHEFDVEVYEYEPEEPPYQHVSLSEIVSREVTERPYYIPLTDVPYPGEIDSTYDLKKFLKGDYCLESDLLTQQKKTVMCCRESYVSEVFKFDDGSEAGSLESLESEEEREVRRYLKMNVDRVSFAGGIIKGIARGVGKFNIFEGSRKSELVTDEQLRRFRLASFQRQSRDYHEKKVSLSLPCGRRQPSKIKRRQTGFVRIEDLEKIHLIQREDSQDDDSPNGSRKVRIAPSAIANQTGARTPRRPTGFVPCTIKQGGSDADVNRQSALTRLYEDVAMEDDNGPTLKDYRLLQESHHKNLLLKYSPNSCVNGEESPREKYLRHSFTADDRSFEEMMNIQHSKKVARKVSSDYVKTLDQMEHAQAETSIRSVEYAKTRPSMSVQEYQAKNNKFQLELKSASSVIEKISDKPRALRGIRLPGDTPLYSMSEVHDHN